MYTTFIFKFTVVYSIITKLGTSSSWTVSKQLYPVFAWAVAILLPEAKALVEATLPLVNHDWLK